MITCLHADMEGPSGKSGMQFEPIRKSCLDQPYSPLVFLQWTGPF